MASDKIDPLIGPTEAYRFSPGDGVRDRTTGQFGTVVDVRPLATGAGAATVIVFLHREKIKVDYQVVWDSVADIEKTTVGAVKSTHSWLRDQAKAGAEKLQDKVLGHPGMHTGRPIKRTFHGPSTPQDSALLTDEQLKADPDYTRRKAAYNLKAKEEAQERAIKRMGLGGRMEEVLRLANASTLTRSDIHSADNLKVISDLLLTQQGAGGMTFSTVEGLFGNAQRDINPALSSYRIQEKEKSINNLVSQIADLEKDLEMRPNHPLVEKKRQTLQEMQGRLNRLRQSVARDRGRLSGTLEALRPGTQRYNDIQEALNTLKRLKGVSTAGLSAGEVKDLADRRSSAMLTALDARRGVLLESVPSAERDFINQVFKRALSGVHEYRKQVLGTKIANNKTSLNIYGDQVAAAEKRLGLESMDMPTLLKVLDLMEVSSGKLLVNGKEVDPARIAGSIRRNVDKQGVVSVEDFRTGQMTPTAIPSTNRRKASGWGALDAQQLSEAFEQNEAFFNDIFAQIGVDSSLVGTPRKSRKLDPSLEEVLRWPGSHANRYVVNQGGALYLIRGAENGSLRLGGIQPKKGVVHLNLERMIDRGFYSTPGEFTSLAGKTVGDLDGPLKGQFSILPEGKRPLPKTERDLRKRVRLTNDLDNAVTYVNASGRKKIISAGLETSLPLEDMIAALRGDGRDVAQAFKRLFKPLPGQNKDLYEDTLQSVLALYYSKLEEYNVSGESKLSFSQERARLLKEAKAEYDRLRSPDDDPRVVIKTTDAAKRSYQGADAEELYIERRMMRDPTVSSDSGMLPEAFTQDDIRDLRASFGTPETRRVDSLVEKLSAPGRSGSTAARLRTVVRGLTAQDMLDLTKLGYGEDLNAIQSALDSVLGRSGRIRPGVEKEAEKAIERISKVRSSLETLIESRNGWTPKVRELIARETFGEVSELVQNKTVRTDAPLEVNKAVLTGEKKALEMGWAMPTSRFGRGADAWAFFLSRAEQVGFRNAFSEFQELPISKLGGRAGVETFMEAVQEIASSALVTSNDARASSRTASLIAQYRRLVKNLPKGANLHDLQSVSRNLHTSMQAALGAEVFDEGLIDELDRGLDSVTKILDIEKQLRDPSLSHIDYDAASVRNLTLNLSRPEDRGQLSSYLQRVAQVVETSNTPEDMRAKNIKVDGSGKKYFSFTAQFEGQGHRELRLYAQTVKQDGEDTYRYQVYSGKNVIDLTGNGLERLVDPQSLRGTKAIDVSPNMVRESLVPGMPLLQTVKGDTIVYPGSAQELRQMLKNAWTISGWDPTYMTKDGLAFDTEVMQGGAIGNAAYMKGSKSQAYHTPEYLEWLSRDTFNGSQAYQAAREAIDNAPLKADLNSPKAFSSLIDQMDSVVESAGAGLAPRERKALRDYANKQAKRHILVNTSELVKDEKELLSRFSAEALETFEDRDILFGQNVKFDVEQLKTRLESAGLLSQKSEAALNAMQSPQRHVDLTTLGQIYQPGQINYKQQQILSRMFPGHVQQHLALGDVKDALQALFKIVQNSGGFKSEFIKGAMPIDPSQVFMDPRTRRAYKITDGFIDVRDGFNARPPGSLGLMFEEVDYGIPGGGNTFASQGYLPNSANLAHDFSRLIPLADKDVLGTVNDVVRDLARGRVRNVLRTKTEKASILGNIDDFLNKYTVIEEALTTPDPLSHLRRFVSKNPGDVASYIDDYILRNDHEIGGTRLLAQFEQMYNFATDLRTTHSPFLETLRGSGLSLEESNKAAEIYFDKAFAKAPLVPVDDNPALTRFALPFGKESQTMHLGTPTLVQDSIYQATEKAFAAKGWESKVKMLMSTGMSRMRAEEYMSDKFRLSHLEESAATALQNKLFESDVLPALFQPKVKDDPKTSALPASMKGWLSKDMSVARQDVSDYLFHNRAAVMEAVMAGERIDYLASLAGQEMPDAQGVISEARRTIEAINRNRVGIGEKKDRMATDESWKIYQEEAARAASTSSGLYSSLSPIDTPAIEHKDFFKSLIGVERDTLGMTNYVQGVNSGIASLFDNPAVKRAAPLAAIVAAAVGTSMAITRPDLGNDERQIQETFRDEQAMDIKKDRVIITQFQHENQQSLKIRATGSANASIDSRVLNRSVAEVMTEHAPIKSSEVRVKDERETFGPRWVERYDGRGRGV